MSRQIQQLIHYTQLPLLLKNCASFGQESSKFHPGLASLAAPIGSQQGCRELTKLRFENDENVTYGPLQTNQDRHSWVWQTTTWGESGVLQPYGRCRYRSYLF